MYMTLSIFPQASNPGQFDSDVDVLWNKGQTQDSVYHMVRTLYVQLIRHGFSLQQIIVSSDIED